MGIDFGYVLIGSVLIFAAGWFVSDWILKRQINETIKNSPQVKFRDRVLAAAGELPRWITHIAADADGAVYGYGYPPDASKDCWTTDRESVYLGFDEEAKAFWRESSVRVP